MFSKNKGFSLVEVMVVVGLLTILSLGSARFIMNQNKSITRLEDRMTRLNLKQEIIGIFNNAPLCEKIIGGMVLKKRQPKEIKVVNDLDRVFFDPDAEVNQYESLLITEATVRDLSLKGKQSVGDVEVLLRVNSARNNNQAMPPIRLQFPVSLNNTGLVRDCYPKRAPLCGSSLIVKAGTLPDPEKDYKNCCPGGGSLGDCITTGMERVGSSASIFYICSCK